VIVENEDKVLVERPFKSGLYDFWVAPVGGARGDKDPRAQIPM